MEHVSLTKTPHMRGVAAWRWLAANDEANNRGVKIQIPPGGKRRSLQVVIFPPRVIFQNWRFSSHCSIGTWGGAVAEAAGLVMAAPCPEAAEVVVRVRQKARKRRARINGRTGRYSRAPQLSDSEKWMDTAVLARALGVEPRTVRRWIKTGRLRARQIGAPKSRWRTRAVDVAAAFAAAILRNDIWRRKAFWRLLS